jgi:uncharacterized protein (TIGR03437 family)
VAFGYISQTFTDATGATIPLSRIDSTGIQFYVNGKIVAGLQSSASGAPVTVISSGSDPVAAIQNAAATWNAVSTAKVNFLPVKTTQSVNDPTDFQMTISVGSTVADLSVLGYSSASSPGAAAVTLNQYVTGGGLLNGMTFAPGNIYDSDIILNPAVSFSTDNSTGADLQSLITHELGHSLGAGHSGLLGATMFQTIPIAFRYLSTDDLSFLTALYPGVALTMGTMTGKIVASDASPVQYGLVTMIDSIGGNVIGALTASDGTYSVRVPPASYMIYAEPIAPGNIVQAANLYIPSSASVTTNFQTTALGGFSSPALVTVATGKITTAPKLVVTAGRSSLQEPYIGTGAAGASGDISAFNIGPRVLISGQSADIGLTGGGIDGTATVQVFGQGISVHAGSQRVDGSLVRVTLDVAATASKTLATVLISQGQNTVCLSGVLIISPPKPVFTSNSVVSAASYKGLAGNGVVSPGGIYSIYDVIANSLGPTVFVQSTGYNDFGLLATTLGNVTVTFDNVPAPIYLAYAGQLNIQVPFEVAGKTVTSVVVNFLGSQSIPVSVPVAPAQPAFFTFTPLGTDAIIQNFPDYSLNSVTNPVARGGVAILYGTGLGKLPYTLATGQPGVVPSSTYSSTYSCSFGGQTASAYGYWNYGFVGEATWTATVPNNSPTGAVPLTCTDTVSGASTQQGTIYVK